MAFTDTDEMGDAFADVSQRTDSNRGGDQLLTPPE
jgi:hypothetical protein